MTKKEGNSYKEFLSKNPFESENQEEGFRYYYS
jgi:hypothetical protein